VEKIHSVFIKTAQTLTNKTQTDEKEHIMKNMIKTTTAALLATVIFTQPFVPAIAKTSQIIEAENSQMFFSDRYVTAYYKVDSKNFKATITIAPGAEGKGNPMQYVNTLSDGERVEYLVGGYGENALQVKLSLIRNGDDVKADIKTQITQNNS